MLSLLLPKEVDMLFTMTVFKYSKHALRLIALKRNPKMYLDRDRNVSKSDASDNKFWFGRVWCEQTENSVEALHNKGGGKMVRGRPMKTILDLSEKQREILLSLLTCREKAAKLNMSVGWVVKWEKRLKEELRKVLKLVFETRSRKQ